jgi:hypothetical protein
MGYLQWLIQNHFSLGTSSETSPNIIIMNPPRVAMSKADALVFAAWIVTLADDYEDGFEKALAAVRS